MYFLMVSSSNPTVLTQYPRLQKCSPVTLLVSQNLPVDSHRTLALDKPYRKRHTLLRRNAYAHVDMVRHQVPFYQLDSSLPAYFPYHLSHVLLQLPVQHPLSILRDDDNMVFTFPPHVG